MKDEFLQYAPPFAGLDENERQALGSGFSQGEVSSGSALFRAGDPANGLYLIGQGFVRMAREDGQVLATLGPGSILGDTALFRGSPYEFTATAVSTVQYWMLGDRSLRDLVLRQPAIGIKLGQNIGSQIIQMEEYLVWRLSKTAELQTLPQNTLQAIASQLRPRPLPAGQALFRSGEMPTGFYMLESGLVEVRSEGGLGGESVQQIQPGSLLGALPLITNKPYAQSAVAGDDSLVWSFPADTFHAVNSRHPGLRRSLGRSLKARLSRADQAQAVTRLQQMPLFAEVQPAVMQALAQRMVLQHVPAGDRVYRVGEAGDALYFVEQGEIELTAENAMGVIEEKARVGGNGFFGEMSVLTGQIRTEDATATRNTNLWFLNKADLEQVSAQNPALSKALSQALASRLATTATPEADDSRFRNFELLAGLSAGELHQVVEYLRPTRYRAGEHIFRVNSPGEMMYLVERGQVRIQPISGGSYLLGPGDEFGERSLLSNQPHNATALAESDADVWTLSRADFSVLMSRSPALAINISRILSQRLGAGNAPVQGGAAQPAGASHQPYQAGYQQGYQPYAAGQAGAQQPTPQQMGQPQRFRPQTQEYAEYDEYPPNAPGARPPRRSIGGWIGGMTTFGKLRVILLIILLLWMMLVAIPWAVLRLLDLANGSVDTVASDTPRALSAILAKGSYEVAAQDSELAQAMAAADQAAPPTPTWTPYPTPTPLVTPTPDLQMASASAAAGVQYTTELLQLGDPGAAQPQAPVPEAAAEQPVAAVAASAQPRLLDPRLGQLGVNVQEADVAPGQPYWRVIEVRFADEVESAGKHHIYVDVLDENGSRMVGQTVTVYWGDGNYSAGLEDKPAPEYGFNYQMYAAGYAYSVKVEGLPSDEVKGAGMGDIANRFKGIHTSYYMTFKKATK